MASRCSLTECESSTPGITAASARSSAISGSGAAQHTIVVYYYQATGTAYIRVWWEQWQPPPPTPITFPDWKGEYYANQQLSGDPAFVRNDPTINFNWGTGGPGGGVPGEHFSARWSRSVDFAANFYQFNARSDDGIRAWVDGNLIIDQWHDSPGNIVYTSQLWLSGSHRLVVEYYQNLGQALVDYWWFVVPPPPTNTFTPPPTATHTATPTATLTPTARDANRDADADNDRNADGHTHRHAHGDADRDADSDTNAHFYGVAHRHPDADGYADSHTHGHALAHANRYSDSHANRHVVAHAHRHLTATPTGTPQGRRLRRRRRPLWYKRRFG